MLATAERRGRSAIPLLLEGVAEGQGSDANRLAEGHPNNKKNLVLGLFSKFIVQCSKSSIAFHLFISSSHHRLIVSSSVFITSRFLLTFSLLTNPSREFGIFIFAPYVACSLRMHTTDYKINIYVLNFIKYETVITINQTVPRDAENRSAQLRAVCATCYPDGDARTDRN